MTPDEELLCLRIQVSKNRLFQLNDLEILLLHFRPLLILSLAAHFHSHGSPLIIALSISTLGLIDLFWLLHDIGHLAVFKDNTHSRAWVDFLSIVFFGFPLSALLFKTHRIHHAHPNVLFKDTALETAPVYWAPAQVERSSGKKAPRHQNLVWFCVALPLSTIFVAYDSLKKTFDEGRYGLVSLTLLRWILLVLWIPKISLFLILPQLLSGFWSGFIAGLNHFHLDQTVDQDSLGFVTQIYRGSQNIRWYSPLATWLTGGLNFHVEHHLFPKVPSTKLKHLRPSTMQLAEKFQLPYHEATPGEIAFRSWKKLKMISLGGV